MLLSSSTLTLACLDRDFILTSPAIIAQRALGLRSGISAIFAYLVVRLNLNYAVRDLRQPFKTSRGAILPEMKMIRLCFIGSISRPSAVPFNAARPANCKAFDGELLDMVSKAPFRAFAVVIDKLSIEAKHFGPVGAHAYHIGLLALLERYCGWLRFGKWTGDVLAESRGGRETCS